MLPRLPFVAGIVSAQVSNDGLLSNLKSTDTTNTLKSRTDWWSMTEDDLSAFPFDASENGFWNGRFLPPPPRPPLLDQKIESDGIHYTKHLTQHNNSFKHTLLGLTTCDLCSWAQKLDKNSFSLDGTITQTVGWTFTLLVVSAISAFLGAVIMIVAFKCKSKELITCFTGRPLPWYRSQRNNSTESYNGSRNNMLTKNQDDNVRNIGNLNASANFTPNTSPIIGSSPNSLNSGVWTWLTKTSNRRNQNPTTSPQHHLQSSTTQENHYTHMEENYSVGLNQIGNQNTFPENVTCIGLVQLNKKNDGTTGEALYAELDHESIGSGTNPSYQNTMTYNEENDVPFVSSAPSSAYYSDLSNSNALTDRGGGGGVYEIVGNNLDGTNSMNSTNIVLSNRPNRLSLSAINETTTPSAPSDYV
ncbi:unnamed protein product [Diamesa hyperborea]